MTSVADRQLQSRREQPIGEVARDLTRDLSLLVRQELELAKAETTKKAKVAATGLGLLGAAGVVAMCAAGALTAFVVLMLALFLPAWLSALIVAASLGVTAYVLALRGKEQVSDAGSPVPEETIETVKEDVEWARTRATSARK